MNILKQQVEKSLISKILDSLIFYEYPKILIYGYTNIKNCDNINIKVFDYLSDLKLDIKDSMQESFAQEILHYLVKTRLDKMIKEDMKLGVYKKDLLGLNNDFVVTKKVYNKLKNDLAFSKSILNKKLEMFQYLEFVGYYGPCRIVVNHLWESNDSLMVSIPLKGLLGFNITDIEYDGESSNAKVSLDVSIYKHEVYKLL